LKRTGLVTEAAMIKRSTRAFRFAGFLETTGGFPELEGMAFDVVSEGNNVDRGRSESAYAASQNGQNQ
jgi:hypothetical protein